MLEARARHPLDGYAPKLLAAYPALSPIGIALRTGDARTRLQEMQDAETETCSQEAQIVQVTDRLARVQAAHTLEMQYLMQFGVKASERHLFRTILEDVSGHGGLSLREAANLTRAQTHRNSDSPVGR
ncbi:MAG: hypothetical protein ACKVT0_05385 [Planctomycetaceae bacterium]